MNNVVGPIDQLDWDTLLMLKRSIRYYRDNFSPMYEEALSKTNNLYNLTLSRVA